MTQPVPQTHTIRCILSNITFLKINSWSLWVRDPLVLSNVGYLDFIILTWKSSCIIVIWFFLYNYKLACNMNTYPRTPHPSPSLTKSRPDHWPYSKPLRSPRLPSAILCLLVIMTMTRLKTSAGINTPYGGSRNQLTSELWCTHKCRHTYCAHTHRYAEETAAKNSKHINTKCYILYTWILSQLLRFRIIYDHMKYKHLSQTSVQKQIKRIMKYDEEKLTFLHFCMKK